MNKIKSFKLNQIIKCGTGKFEVVEVSDRLVLRNLNEKRYPFYVRQILTYRDKNEYVKCRVHATNELLTIRAKR